ncbi:conserved hypothetical protein [Altererythrobacter sp. B11]|uniref:helix-turn-helix transcriptional regulator n=1 Tax=Altererythrobacter sp. B11 TaxID=2060312 RepID=UPI000DC73A8E|nr:helix-turn-helix transcriptional regulator [Altererythrobacter sp. B11]BBC73809.1 conserved hypothetical protein [Altererythrobacter sp. B11]
MQSAGLFREAALGLVPWENALNTFADALNSRTGQLIAIGRRSLVPLNIMTRLPSEATGEFLAVGGGDPHINSRVRAGLAAGEMEFRDQGDFTPEQDRLRSPEFGDWIDRNGIGYTCITNLRKRSDELIGLAALRTVAQGEMHSAEKRAFRLLSGHARAAVILRNSVEDQALHVLAATLDQLETAAAIVDIAGNVRALTERGETVVAGGRFLRLVQGRLHPQRPEHRAQFDAMLRRALQSREGVDIPPPGPMVLTDCDGRAMALEILPLPGGHSFTFAAAAMLVFRGESPTTLRRMQIAAELYGLTPAECRVAEHLLQGRAPVEIARLAHVSVGTVRNHVHRILAKSGCASQVEFLAAIGRYG